MRRTLVRLATATSIVAGTLALATGPASAGLPQESGDKDCRIINDICNPAVHNGWTVHPSRNVGGRG